MTQDTLTATSTRYAQCWQHYLREQETGRRTRHLTSSQRAWCEAAVLERSARVGRDRATILTIITAELCGDTCLPYPIIMVPNEQHDATVSNGCIRWHNATRLWHEIKQQGYRGGCTRVRDFVAPFRQQRSGMDEGTMWRAAVTDGAPPTVRTLRGCVLQRPDQITQREQNLVHQLRTAHPIVDEAVQLTQAFAAMVRQRQPEHLEPWLWQVANSEVAALRRFAAGIQRDKAAVLASLTLEWSQGQVEGQVNRLKLVKRSMYGRANFDLLRLRVLNPP